VPDQHEVSHADIYHKLGSLEAKLDAAIGSVVDYKTTLNEAFGRIRRLEDKTVWMIGMVAGLSVVVPLLVHILGNNFHLELKPKTVATLTTNKVN
jgi:hypothetical protein